MSPTHDPARRLRVSLKSSCVQQSEIRNMSIESDRLGGINLSQGVCDTEVPLEVRRGAQAAMDEGVNTYTRYDGIPELRRAIAKKLLGYGMPVDADREITVSGGATGAFYCACMALLDPGDEVILFEPSYGYHIQTLEAVGLQPKPIKLAPPDWSFTAEQLERATTSKTRAIIVNTPANPSGKVFSVDELLGIGAWAEKHDVFVFTDEIYEYFVYDGRKHVPPASLPGMRERTITISGMSKTFSITGWRIGYSVSDPQWSQTIGFFSDLIYVCAPAPLQMGVARGLELLGPEYYEQLRAEYALKRDKICTALDRAGMTPYVPQGAYYVLADISRLPGKTSKDRAMHLLRDGGVASVPGEAFYENPIDGNDLARFCFAKQPADLDEACRRLERYGSHR